MSATIPSPFNLGLYQILFSNERTNKYYSRTLVRSVCKDSIILLDYRDVKCTHCRVFDIVSTSIVPSVAHFSGTKFPKILNFIFLQKHIT